jgi:AraC-like DNA-binding protein
MAEPIAEAALGRPPPHLRAFVREYVGYRLEGYPPGTHRGLPSGALTCIVSLAGPVDIAGMPDQRQPAAAYETFVSGLHAGHALIRHDGTQHGVSLTLTPLAARRLFAMPPAELASTVVPLGDVFGPGRELVERLAEAGSWAERFAVLDQVLERAVCDMAPPAPEVDHVWHRLVSTDGAAPVHALAGEVGWSRRHLSERFRLEFGLTPKVAGRILRFDRSKRMLRTQEAPDLATVAARCGYYDQPHLNRDWRDLAGCSPGAWLAEEGMPVSVGDAEGDGDPAGLLPAAGAGAR